MARSYQDYIASKDCTFQPLGIDVEPSELLDQLFDYQKACVSRALKLGRSALFQNMGLGKGIQQLVWLDVLNNSENKPVLLVAPLAVSKQFVKEAAKVGIDVNPIESDTDVVNGINVINYHKIHKISPGQFAAISLDESSLLRGDGPLARSLISFASGIHYRLSATATPSPNDLPEFGLQAEFLGIMSNSEMVAEFFIQDGGNTQKKRLKGHAEQEFWKWLASFSSCFKSPADIGFEHEAAQFELPPIIDEYITVDSDLQPEPGQLFASAAGLSGRSKARKASLKGRVEAIADIVNASNDFEIIWCERNDEADALEKLIPESKQVKGSMPPEQKERWLNAFSDRELRVMITKPSIAGWGLNWQHCCNITFAGVGDSFEAFTQASGRVHRYGQTQQVTRRIAFSEPEREVFENLQRKAALADRIWESVKPYFAKAFQATKRYQHDYQPTQKMEIPQWLRAS